MKNSIALVGMIFLGLGFAGCGSDGNAGPGGAAGAQGGQQGGACTQQFLTDLQTLGQAEAGVTGCEALAQYKTKADAFKAKYGATKCTVTNPENNKSVTIDAGDMMAKEDQALAQAQAACAHGGGFGGGDVVTTEEGEATPSIQDIVQAIDSL